MAALGAAAAGGDGRAPILRIRGGSGVADVGRAQAPLKRANAFKIAVRNRDPCIGYRLEPIVAPLVIPRMRTGIHGGSRD